LQRRMGMMWAITTWPVSATPRTIMRSSRRRLLALAHLRRSPCFFCDIDSGYHYTTPPARQGKGTGLEWVFLASKREVLHWVAIGASSFALIAQIRSIQGTGL